MIEIDQRIAPRAKEAASRGRLLEAIFKMADGTIQPIISACVRALTIPCVQLTEPQDILGLEQEAVVLLVAN